MQGKNKESIEKQTNILFFRKKNQIIPRLSRNR